MSLVLLSEKIIDPVKNHLSGFFKFLWILIRRCVELNAVTTVIAFGDVSNLIESLV